MLDPEDEYLRATSWVPSVDHGGPYALCSVDGKVTRLHRIVVKAAIGQVVDHVNGNTLDNRKSNLRIVSRSKNSLNRAGASKANVTTKQRNVYYENGKYRVRICVGYKMTNYGRYDSLQDAVKVAISVRKMLGIPERN